MNITKTGRSLLFASGVGAMLLAAPSLVNYGTNKITNSPEYLRMEAKELMAENIEKADTSAIHRDMLYLFDSYKKADRDKHFEESKIQMKNKQDYIKDGGLFAVDDNAAIAVNNAGVTVHNTVGTAVNKMADFEKHLIENPDAAAAMATVGGIATALSLCGARRRYDEVAEANGQKQEARIESKE